MATYDYKPNVDVYEVTNQSVIIITEDKLTLTLNSFEEQINRNRDWSTPLGIAITIALVLVTTDFKTVFGIEKNTWNAIFIISLILCIIWAVRAFYRLGKTLTVKQLIAKIKSECISQAPNTPPNA